MIGRYKNTICLERHLVSINLKTGLRLSATAWIHDNGENLDAEGMELVAKLNSRMEKLTGLTSATAEAYQEMCSCYKCQPFQTM